MTSRPKVNLRSSQKGNVPEEQARAWGHLSSPPPKPEVVAWRSSCEPGFCLTSIFQGPKCEHFQTHSHDPQAWPFGRTVTTEGRLEVRERGTCFVHRRTGQEMVVVVTALGRKRSGEQKQQLSARLHQGCLTRGVNRTEQMDRDS